MKIAQIGAFFGFIITDVVVIKGCVDNLRTAVFEGKSNRQINKMTMNTILITACIIIPLLVSTFLCPNYWVTIDIMTIICGALFIFLMPSKIISSDVFRLRGKRIVEGRNVGHRVLL